MAGVRYRVLFHGVTLTALPLDVFTCPVDRTAIVRHVALYNAAGTTQTYLLSVRRGAALATVWRGAVATLDVAHPQLRDVVLEPGDVLVLGTVTGGAPNARLLVCGSLLAGAPV